MSNVLGALASALGGAASAGAEGLGNIQQRHVQRDQIEYGKQQDAEQKDIQLRQLFMQRQQLDHQIAVSTDERERQSLRDEQAKIDAWAKNLAGAGVTIANPNAAYKHAMANPQSLTALTQAAQTRASELAKANQPLGALTGTEYDQFGGAMVENKTFNPFAATSANARAGSAALVAKARMLSSSINQILRAKNNAYSSYSQQPEVASLLASVDENVNRAARAKADEYSVGEARKTAAGALNTLRAAFPNDPEISQLTVEDLLGMLSEGGSNLGGPPSAGGFSDPLGIGGGAPQQPPSASAPQQPANPLGLGTTAPRPATPPAGPQNDPLGILSPRRPPEF